jgi:hypothetical protein
MAGGSISIPVEEAVNVGPEGNSKARGSFVDMIEKVLKEPVCAF